jgi:catechol 2,3-dioxygenase-like lactoylglutathione lyase family enzyme
LTYHTPRKPEPARVTRDEEVDLKVIRIVCNIESQDLPEAQSFYGEILGLDLLMDLGWIRTYGSRETKPVQISMLSEGGSGTPVPELSIEVDDIEEALRRIRAAMLPIEYGPADEPWGVRRFYVRDPFGKLVNVLAHT